MINFNRRRKRIFVMPSKREMKLRDEYFYNKNLEFLNTTDIREVYKKVKINKTRNPYVAISYTFVFDDVEMTCKMLVPRVNRVVVYA